MKSIYSLVLDDEIIKRIDMLANKSGRSRSAMINDILAEHVSYNSPERVSRELIGRMNEVLSCCDEFGILLQDTSMSLRSVISYKYNPTVRYALEVIHEDGICAILRVNVRSRSEAFMELFASFLAAWRDAELEANPTIGYAFEPGKFTRLLKPKDDIDEERLADAFAGYISYFDESLKGYFANSLKASRAYADKKLLESYRRRAGSSDFILL